jgi:hypothetical protein
VRHAVAVRSNARRVVVALAVLVATLGASPYLASAIEVNVVPVDLVCARPTTPDNSDFDYGSRSIRWFPPGVGCSYVNPRAHESFFPTFGTSLVAAGLVAGEAATALGVGLVRRQRRKRSAGQPALRRG